MSRPHDYHKATISLCMIARDEERLIGQAIDSVQSIVSEIIVVDTGSVDSTREVAQARGALVLEHPWQDDFATPRNVGIAKATGEWILVLDADEAIASEQLQALLSLTSDTSMCYELTQRHYSDDHRLSGYEPTTGEYPAWERQYRGYFESSLVRFFPNGQGIHYIGRVHELVEPSIQKRTDLNIKRAGILLHHYGHTPEVLEVKNKNKLYRALGETKITDEPKDWKAFFELGVECNKPGQQEESVNAFKRSLELNPSYIPSWINLGYVLCELGRLTEAVTCLASALDKAPNSPEAHCNLGVAYMRLGDYASAEQHLRQAIRIHPRYVNAFFNLSQTLACLGRLPEAILMCERILELCPSNPRALIDLGALYAAGGVPGVARSFLTAALQVEPANERARSLLCQLGIG